MAIESVNEGIPFATETCAETAKDYLGHPCKFTEAKKHFELPSVSDHRQYKRQIGILLCDIDSRMSHLGNALEAMRDIDSEDERLTSLLEIAAAYGTDTSNNFFKLAGWVIAQVEQSELDRSQFESGNKAGVNHV